MNGNKRSPRRTIKVYACQLTEAKNILKHHCGVDYNNDLQIRLAEQWFDDTIRALVKGYDLPPRPTALMDRAQ